jgi:hypothetical protein
MAAFALTSAPMTRDFGRSGYNKDDDDKGRMVEILDFGRSGYNKDDDEGNKGRSGYNRGGDDDESNKGRSGYN